MILQNLKNGKISNRKKREKLEFQKNPGESLEKEIDRKMCEKSKFEKMREEFRIPGKKSSKNLECENVGENLKENSRKKSKFEEKNRGLIFDCEKIGKNSIENP